MSGQCARPGCGEPAAARLAADFNRREGWLRDTSASASKHDYAFCAPHADRLRLPLGWSLYDERSTRLQAVAPPEPARPPEPPPPPPPEPAASAPVPAPTPIVGERPVQARLALGDPALDDSPLLARAFRQFPPDPEVS